MKSDGGQARGVAPQFGVEGSLLIPFLRRCGSLLLGALRLQVHGRAALQHAEGERLSQVEVDLVLVVPRVSDGQILSYAELKVAAARRRYGEG